MAIIKCKECGAQISDKAKTCPHCGAKLPRKPSNIPWTMLALFIAIVSSFAYLSVKTAEYENAIFRIKIRADLAGNSDLTRDDIKAAVHSLGDDGPSKYDFLYVMGLVVVLVIYLYKKQRKAESQRQIEYASTARDDLLSLSEEAIEFAKAYDQMPREKQIALRALTVPPHEQKTG